MNTPHFNIPLFPLNLLPLPGETIALHIFEERFQTLFDRLESMEIDEFGIPFVNDEQQMKLGGLMRLVFASEPDENGFRDAAVRCIGLFTLEDFTKSSPHNEAPPYPTGTIRRWSEWKSFMLSEKATADFSKAATLSNAPAKTGALGQPNDGLMQALIQHQITPQKRFNILSAMDDRSRNEQIDNAARFTFLIAEQEAHRNKGYFPN